MTVSTPQAGDESKVPALPVPLPERNVPIVIGVTGHRDPVAADVGELRRHFGEILARYRREYPSTPLVVLSGLATGADSIAADEAFAQAVPVIACLASPLERFEKDFTDDEREALYDRLARCARIDVVADDPKRESGFIAVKAYLNRYSNLVVAFWDGDAGPGGKPKAGGTADVVADRLSGAHISDLAAMMAPAAPDAGPVIQIVTAREGRERPERTLQVVEMFPRSPIAKIDMRREFEGALKRLDIYNADIARESAGSELEPCLATLRRWTADCATRYQDTTNRYLRLFFAMGFGTAVLTVVAEPLMRIAAIAAAFFVYRLAAGRDHQNRYQDYRAFSEALRVQLAWNSIGLTNESVDVAYLRMYQSELEWIRMAIRASNLVFSIDPRYAATFPKNGYRKWVDEQASHFTKSVRAQRERLARLRAYGNRSAIAGVVIGAVPFTAGALATLAGMKITPPHVAEFLGIASTALSAVVHGLVAPVVHVVNPHGTDTLTDQDFRRFGAAAITVGLIAKALLAGYAERQNLAADVKRYARMEILFAEAKRLLDDIEHGKPGDVRALVRDLGREALVEQADWLLLRRDRPLVLVQGT
jgi:hypothetical protein